MRDLPCDLSQLQSVLDYAFNVIEENFVNGEETFVDEPLALSVYGQTS